MDIRFNGAGSNGFLRYQTRKNVDPERLIGHLNNQLLFETLAITPFLRIGDVDIANVTSMTGGERETARHVGEIVVRSRNGGTILYQDMDIVLREGLLFSHSPLAPAAYVASGHGAACEVPPLHITLHASSDGRPAMVRRHDAVYRGLLRKDAPAPAYIDALLPTETMLDHSLDGRWHYM